MSTPPPATAAVPSTPTMEEFNTLRARYELQQEQIDMLLQRDATAGRGAGQDDAREDLDRGGAFDNSSSNSWMGDPKKLFVSKEVGKISIVQDALVETYDNTVSVAQYFGPLEIKALTPQSPTGESTDTSHSLQPPKLIDQPPESLQLRVTTDQPPESLPLRVPNDQPPESHTKCDTIVHCKCTSIGQPPELLNGQPPGLLSLHVLMDQQPELPLCVPTDQPPELLPLRVPTGQPPESLPLDIHIGQQPEDTGNLPHKSLNELSSASLTVFPFDDPNKYVFDIPHAMVDVNLSVQGGRDNQSVGMFEMLEIEMPKFKKSGFYGNLSLDMPQMPKPDGNILIDDTYPGDLGVNVIYSISREYDDSHDDF